MIDKYSEEQIELMEKLSEWFKLNCTRKDLKLYFNYFNSTLIEMIITFEFMLPLEMKNLNEINSISEISWIEPSCRNIKIIL
jgi:hypothetical protein